MMPRVAIVISSYQAEPYIECAVRSVLAQSFGDFELVVQDDASTDRTVEIARSICDRRISVFASKSNRGAVNNVNAGIARTSAPLVVKLDADDYLLPDFLVRCHCAMRVNPDAAFVFTEAHRVVDGKITGVRTGWRADGVIPGVDFIHTALGSHNPCSASAVMFRREAFEAAGGFRWPASCPPFGEDFALWLRMARWGSVVYLAKPLSAFRAHGDGLTASVRNCRESLRVMADEVAAAVGPDKLLARQYLRGASHSLYCLQQAWHYSASETVRGLLKLISTHPAPYNSVARVLVRATGGHI